MDIYEVRRARLRELLATVQQVDLAQLTGIAASLLSRYAAEPRDGRQTKNIGEQNARKIEAGAGKPHGWLDRHPQIRGHISLTTAEAHPVSLEAVEHAPLVSWGALMKAEQLPAVFWTSPADESMAPRVPAGRRVCFDRRLHPRAGDGVLVTDSHGNLLFRIYKIGAGPRWVASALNPAYADLDSVADDLRVIAVLISEEGRWSV